MNLYSLALFFHIVGALGLFAALGLEWARLHQIQGATNIEQIQASMKMYKSVRRFGMASMLTIFIFGVYLTMTWGLVMWLITSLGALVLTILLTVVLTRPRMAAIEQALSVEEGLISPALQQLVNHPLLWISLHTRVAVTLGIVFLMTVKPGMGGSLLTIAVAVIIGLAASLPLPNRRRVLDVQTDGTLK